MRTLKFTLLALVFVITGVGENLSIDGMLPFVSDTSVAAQVPPTGFSGGITGFPEQFVMSWTGDLGAGLTNAAVNTMKAPCKGHFTDLQCTATLTGACTTGPTVNVTDVTASASGTAVSPTTTVATIADQVETLTFNSGDTIGFSQTATTGTCTAPRYACSATATCP